MRISLIGSIAAALIVAAPAMAEDNYPSRPVEMVVPFVAGGNTDILTRIVADQLQKSLHQTFVVVNRPGAGTNIGASSVANGKPDGYSILVAPPASFVINQFLYKTMPFNQDTAFTPVSMIATVPNVLVVSPSLGVKSIRELIDKAKANPGKINFASAGIGSTSHLSGALFGAMAGIQITHIPYKGTAQSIQDVVAGRVGMTIDNLGPILPFIQSGKVIALGVSTRDPVSLLPGIPPIGTVVRGYEANSWNAMAVPAGTPKAIVNKLSATTDHILHDPTVVQKFRALGSEPVGGTPETVAAFIVKDKARWKQAIEAAHLGKM